MSQIVMKRLAAWPVNRRKALGAGVAVCGIGVGGYIALRSVTIETEGGEDGDDANAGGGIPAPKKLFRRMQRSLIGGRHPATIPPTAAEESETIITTSSSTSMVEFPSGPAVVSAFSSWVKGPLVKFCQMPITYLRARLVNGESSMRIQAANKEIDACMADAELAFARVFDGSADTCQSMVMDITGLNPKNGGKVDDLSKSASVRRGTAVAAEAGLAMEAQEAAVRVDGALLTALVNVEDAVRAAAGLAGAMQSVRLRSPLTSVSDEGGPTSVSELLKDVVFVEALLTSSKDSSAVAKQGLAVWQKGQFYRKRLEQLCAYVRLVKAASVYADQAIELDEIAIKSGARKRNESMKPVLAVYELKKTIDDATACSKLALNDDGSFVSPYSPQE